MQSPFPGMDPYLEQYWGDVQTTLMVYACNQINEQLSDDLQARIEESVPEPCVSELDDEPRTHRHLVIVDLSERGRVVTLIEVLSPANKVGLDGPVNYVRKQREYLDAGINLVEIDLVREGDFVLAAPQGRIPPAYRTPYLICVRRKSQRGRVELYRAPSGNGCPTSPSRCAAQIRMLYFNSSR